MTDATDDTYQINQLFSACDLDGSGYIDESELATICTDLSPEQISDIFHELDIDGDGHISISEFAKGLQVSMGFGKFIIGNFLSNERVSYITKIYIICNLG